MGKKHSPHRGSIAYYPRKRAAKQTASFRSFALPAGSSAEQCKPLNFLGYKAGMTQVIGRDANQAGVTFGQEVAVPVTVIECPALSVFGVRAYAKNEKGYGIVPLFDVFAQNIDKRLLRKITAFRHRQQKGKGEKAAEKNGDLGKEAAGKKENLKKEGKKRAAEKPLKTIDDLEKAKEKIVALRLLCHSRPASTNAGKKRPDVSEIVLSGSREKQLQYAKEKLGRELNVKDVFAERQFADIKAVTKGKGTQGPVKRFGIKIQRRKAKTLRVVGSIGPWHPSTVMFTVPRPGQMGYHSRTELNKKIMRIGTAAEADAINPSAGFTNYGILQNDFMLLAGTVAGPVKRAISLRHNTRAAPAQRYNLESIDFIASSREKPSIELEEGVKAKHIVAEKEEKKEKKSVADEIAAAARGEEKREKPKGE
ncbi:MAG: 50S ribosomal protein L3 [Candidatus Diapherotrites archaeon]|nr:50S ribosomal protein L3 [Candidatus Diapherotrites archaeon]